MKKGYLNLFFIFIFLPMLFPVASSFLIANDKFKFSYQEEQNAFDDNQNNTLFLPLIQNKQIDKVTPGTFFKINPTNNAVFLDTSQEINWSNSVGAGSYSYCYDTSNDNNCSNWISTGTVTNAVVNGLETTTTYYWQVRATNEAGITYADGSPSSYWSFTTKAATQPPETFSKTIPSHSAIDLPTNLTLVWEESSGASNYSYCLDTSNDNSCTNWISTGTSAEAGLNNLATSTTYYWQVRATNEAGITYANGSASSYWSFTTKAASQPPGPFSKYVPSNGAVEQPTNLNLYWGYSNEGTSYDYCYHTGDNDCTDWVSTGFIPQAKISGLSINTTYYWQVRATNALGTTYANESEPMYWSFTTGNGEIIPGALVFIPAGVFEMGCHPDHNGGDPCFSWELPLHTVYLDDYYIDKYEVTNSQYAGCVSAGKCAPPKNNFSNTRASYYGNPTFADYPIIYVNWRDARDYCAWSGKRLPTEAEWEKAARGPTVRTYPWGDHIKDCSLANYYTGGNTGYCMDDTTKIGSYPAGASPYGVMDMAGNVWEWINDWYDPDYYNYSPDSNPKGPSTGAYRGIRGGDLNDPRGSILLRTGHRDYNDILTTNFTFGFRCAFSP
jgi:formylglycine-generating enzyme required for sulfatase activity